MLVGIDEVKSMLYGRLRRNPKLRFSSTLTATYYDQLCGEQRIMRYVRGQPVYRFERIPGKRVECWDCLVYGTAARGLVNVGVDRRRAELAGKPRKAVQKMRQSSWVG